jgi:GTPase SAR1 family protein
MSVPSIVRHVLSRWRMRAHSSLPDIRTWHANIEQHASEGVNKILIGNKSDWTDKRAVTEEQGRELAEELGIRFMETSAKVNEGVEEAFFTLARYVSCVSIWYEAYLTSYRHNCQYIVTSKLD